MKIEDLKVGRVEEKIRSLVGMVSKKKFFFGL